MKNNKNLKVACGLLVLVLLTTCVIGTTLARYTTADSASDTARVAKWGIELAVGGTLFGTDYAENSATDAPDEMIASTSQSVSSSDGKSIVAPGTKNTTGFAFNLSGTPEVAYDVKVTVDYNESIESIYLVGGYTYGVMLPEYGVNETTDRSALYVKNSDGTYSSATTFDAGTTYYRLHDALDLSTDYYPVVWTVKGAYRLAALDSSTNDFAGLVDTISAAVDALEGAANEDSTASFVLTWAWAIDGQDDAADTILGNLMANNGNVVARADGTLDFVTVEVDTVNNVATADGVIVANLEVAFMFGASVTQVD